MKAGETLAGAWRRMLSRGSVGGPTRCPALNGFSSFYRTHAHTHTRAMRKRNIEVGKEMERCAGVFKSSRSVLDLVKLVRGGFVRF